MRNLRMWFYETLIVWAFKKLGSDQYINYKEKVKITKI